jgi:flagellin
MTRINTNVSSLTAQKTLARSNAQLQQAMTRLSTGLRINVGKDDPAGLIASEALNSDIISTQKAISNSERANQVIATADSALGQVSSLLNDIRGLITEAANTGAMSPDQIAANQLQVDSSLDALNRIAQTTSFQGRHLLDGSLDFVTEGAAATSFDEVGNLQIYQANLGTQDSMTVDVVFGDAAAQAVITGDDAALTGTLVLQVSGSRGSQVFNFESGATMVQVAAAIDSVSDATGVSATTDGTTGYLTLTSTDYGAKAFVAAKVISEGTGGAFKSTLDAERATGSDIEATVNGYTAKGDGNTFSVNTATLSLTATVDDGTNTDFSFDITDEGGALFQLGPSVVSTQQTRMGIGSVDTAHLGGASGRLYEIGSGGDNNLTDDPTTAAKIVDQAIKSVAALRGRLGAFQRSTIESNINSLNDTMENLTAALSAIKDADFAVESANLTRAQILAQSGTAVLAIANKNPENVLALLR